MWLLLRFVKGFQKMQPDSKQPNSSFDLQVPLVQIIAQHAEVNQKQILFIRLEMVLEEADESLYWLEVAQEAKLIQAEKLESLIKEANETCKNF